MVIFIIIIIIIAFRFCHYLFVQKVAGSEAGAAVGEEGPLDQRENAMISAGALRKVEKKNTSFLYTVLPALFKSFFTESMYILISPCLLFLPCILFSCMNMSLSLRLLFCNPITFLKTYLTFSSLPKGPCPSGCLGGGTLWKSLGGSPATPAADETGTGKNESQTRPTPSESELDMHFMEEEYDDRFRD